MGGATISIIEKEVMYMYIYIDAGNITCIASILTFICTRLLLSSEAEGSFSSSVTSLEILGIADSSGKK